MMTTAAKLSERAKSLLWLVYRDTDCDWGTGEIRRFFVPRADLYHFTHRGHGESTYISGPGDASSFKSLESRGLIKRPRTSLPNKYVYAITEDGLAVVQELVADGEFGEC